MTEIEIECKICRRGVKTIYDAQFDVDYYYCRNCGFIFMDHEKIVPQEQEKKRYLAHINRREDTGYVNMLKRFIETGVKPFCKEMNTALDFGSGPGPVLAELLIEMGYEVDIYDIYFAPKKVYRSKTYDLITCTEVLEHVKNPLEILKTLEKHLNPGGILSVMTLFHPVDGCLPGEEAFKTWWYRRDPTHISFFRPETFQYISGLLGMTILMMDKKNIVSFAKHPTGKNVKTIKNVR